jgi:hypothetical protein
MGKTSEDQAIKGGEGPEDPGFATSPVPRHGVVSSSYAEIAEELDVPLPEGIEVEQPA